MLLELSGGAMVGVASALTSGAAAYVVVLSGAGSALLGAIAGC